uniref:Uncharacterized protein n=1 Tax=Rhizophora mucronata TaxID=61149 RepID=A0A2P2NXC7_RHIMU
MNPNQVWLLRPINSDYSCRSNIISQHEFFQFSLVTASWFEKGEPWCYGKITSL